MRIIKRSTNIDALQAWLIGGITDSSGNTCEGFNSFFAQETDNYPKTLEETKSTIETLIFEFGDEPCGDEPFEYFGKNYTFGLPLGKKFDDLSTRIWKEISQINQEHLNDWKGQ